MIETKDESQNIQGPIGNYYDKFNTRNPIARRLMAGFLDSFRTFYQQASPKDVLEIGCGSGDMLDVMHHMGEANLHGFDVDIPMLLEAQRTVPHAMVTLGDGHQTAYADSSFDLVVVCEVLEHVAYPHKVIAEAKRLTKQYAILSVPREPIWRVLNVARGKYLTDFGNTPGHIQHWSTRAFIADVEQHFRVVNVRTPLPWTMLLCEKS